MSAVGNWAGLSVNDTVCKSGNTTNRTCGIVKGKDYMPNGIPNSNRFIQATYCADSGDSGAGVYGDEVDGTAHKAIGIHSGGIPGVDCGDFNWPDEFSYFSHVEYAESALDFTVEKY